MLELVNITKDYPVANTVVHALRGVSMRFRKNEFVAILGASGCGKTTLLNIIGGLDHYSSGDLIINGTSTKEYKDRDWDFYRNHSIGFVFQSYNLIPHQTVLANVELALTLSGVSKSERRARAKAALEQVGLGDQFYKLPKQMSGGQMQRVAIARALVNDPDIILADEPTGALDSTTSVQIMEILKEISHNKLIIMVTHNPELADEYANRIIRVKDGLVVDDSRPYTEDEIAEENATLAAAAEERKAAKKEKGKEKKHISMSFFTALALSFRNLMTKKARTIMISLAGSIGIIGIALILSVSTGVQALIDSLERSTMASYPLTVQSVTFDLGSMLSAMMESGDAAEDKQEGQVYSHNVVSQMISGMAAGITKNDLTALKKYLESDEGGIKDAVNDIHYSYLTNLHTYLEIPTEGGITTYRKGMSDYTELMAKMGLGSFTSGTSSSTLTSLSAGSSSASMWNEVIGDEEYLSAQYTVLYGKLPEDKYDLVLYVNDNNEISDYVLYMLGILDVEQLKEYTDKLDAFNNDPEHNEEPEPLPTVHYTYEELCGMSFRLLSDADQYKYNETSKIAEPKTDAELFATLADPEENAPELHIVGILAPSPDAVMSSTAGGIGYTKGLMDDLIARVDANPIVAEQKKTPDYDIFTGKAFRQLTVDDYDAIMERVRTDPQYASYVSILEKMTPENVVAMANAMMPASEGSYDNNLIKLGVVDPDSPNAISIYPKDFESKDIINASLQRFSDTYSKLTYTDTVELLMSSITTIVDAISYVLIAFVAISLVVSSIMIGVITYISVLERIKEIGVLRAMGASKHDISRVFNAETTVIGFAAGALGILISLFFIVIINIILHALTGLEALNAVLHPLAAVVLIAVSIVLTLISGLIPSGIAARKDPVEALRSE